jgi:hypothetical protein
MSYLKEEFHAKQVACANGNLFPCLYLGTVLLAGKSDTGEEISK